MAFRTEGHHARMTKSNRQHTSCPDLIRASIFFAKILAKRMDCRVKPGNTDKR